ncbi:hypothetical protein ACFORL_11825 [Legionella dresdenensis]|uniref:Uncharacterized protein n=1 Tax=Legionella dresdenensis TaxID=450200 RepID=A0ABV8CID9_9GAMM
MSLKTRKIPYYLVLTLLTGGASIMLGFLSFGGMFALWAFLPVALGAFGLSVAYEGEIYLQNVRGALNKLFFKPNYLKEHFAREYLLKQIKDGNLPDPENEKCPLFFRDYFAQLKRVNEFNHDDRYTKEGEKLKKRELKRLRMMDKWFAQEFFADDNEENLTAYQQDLRAWFNAGEREKLKQQYKTRTRVFYGAAAFSVIVAAFASLGTIYLAMDTFLAIPLLAGISAAALPYIIVPMAIIAGVAYGFLTYNAITDMINNDSIRKWYTKIRDSFKDGVSFRNVIIAALAVTLTALSIALTICTAGTWWTVAKNSTPLFAWMAKVPSIIIGVVTGLSSLFFNVENIGESLKIFWELSWEVIKKQFANAIEVTKALWASEGAIQLLNPFRIILKLTITPLRILLFLGHLISIGVTADRVPGISQVASALLGIISEGFEDLHYFFGHMHDEHKHTAEQGAKEQFEHLLKEHVKEPGGHNHDKDIPTQLMILPAYPIYLLAALWDWTFDKNRTERFAFGSLWQNRHALWKSFVKSWNKQHGILEEQEFAEEKVQQHKVSPQWSRESTVLRIDRHQEKYLNNAWVSPKLAKEKKEALTQLKQVVRENQQQNLQQILQTAKADPTYNKQRFFSFSEDAQARTAELLQDLEAESSAVAITA